MSVRPARARIADEQGYVLLTVVIVMLIISLTIIAAVASSVQTSRSSLTAATTVGAQQAADTGLREATYEYNISAVDFFSILGASAQANAGSLGAQNVSNCVTGTVGSVGVNGAAGGLSVATQTGNAAGGWCAAVTDDLGNGQAYSYQTSPANVQYALVSSSPPSLLCLVGCVTTNTYNVTVDRKVVSTGTDAGATRRIAQRIFQTGTVTTQQCVGLLPLSCIAGSLLSALGVPVGSGVLQVPVGAQASQGFSPETGSYRQCPSTPPSGSDPSANCNLPQAKYS